MKYLICSDIHGSIDSVEIILKYYKELKCDGIICLGDVLYHGPRNDLPQSYNPKAVINALTPFKDVILCIKGNCEAEVDQMVLNFKILDSFDGIINNTLVHMEHGHHLDQYTGNASLVLFGHTHIPLCENRNNQIFINPGSITIPKNGSNRSFAIWDNDKIIGLDINNEKNFEIYLK